MSRYTEVQIPGDVFVLDPKLEQMKDPKEPLDLPLTDSDQSCATSACCSNGGLDHVSVHSNYNGYDANHQTPCVSNHTPTDPTLSNEVPQNPTAAATIITNQELNSSMEDADDCKPMANGKLPSALQMTLSKLSPEVSTIAEDYFVKHPQDVIAWQAIDFIRKKKKPDFAVIRYYRQVLTLHTKLKNHGWPNDWGSLRSKDLLQILGFSASWFSVARAVLKEYEKIGPDSGRANDAVIARFQARAADKKDNDLLKFLQTQRKLIERGVV